MSVLNGNQGLINAQETNNVGSGNTGIGTTVDAVLTKLNKEELKNPVVVIVENGNGNQELRNKDGSGILANYDNNTDLPILYNDTLENPEEMSRWTKTGNAFKKILIRSLSLTEDPFLNYPVRVFTAAVEIVLNLAQNGGKNIWEQIERQMDVKIGKEMTRYHFDNLGHVWKKMNKKMQKGMDFSLNDLEYLVTQKHKFFPQDQLAVIFTSQFVSAIKAYLIYLSAGWIELIKQDKVSECSLAAELAILRKDIIMAAKAMHRKRYQQIEGINYNLARVPRGHYPRPNCENIDQSKSCSQFRLLKYKDKLTEWVSHWEWLPHIEKRVFRKIRDETNTIIMKLVNDFNDLYLKEEICQPGCDVPERISKKEISFSYPRKCYGTNGQGNPCPIPCDFYNWKALFCPTKPLEEQGWRGASLDYSDDKWRYCSKISWDKCMKIKDTELSGFDAKSQQNTQRTQLKSRKLNS